MRAKQKEIAFSEIVYVPGPAGGATYAWTLILECQSIYVHWTVWESEAQWVSGLVCQSRLIGRTGIWVEFHLASKAHSYSVQESCLLFSVGWEWQDLESEAEGRRSCPLTLQNDRLAGTSVYLTLNYPAKLGCACLYCIWLSIREMDIFKRKVNSWYCCISEISSRGFHIGGLRSIDF